MKTVSTAGVEIPVVGLGVWKMNAQDCQRLIPEALDVGYRHIDTASIYGNEADVGIGLRAASVPRDQVFVTTKIWIDDVPDMARAAEAALKRLQLDYVDLLLIHWPHPGNPLPRSIADLNAVKARGLTRAIGVSNFSSALFNEAQALSEATLATNQVEYHPYLSQKAVRQAARAAGSSVTAWSPLYRGAVSRDPVLQAIAADHGVTPAQVTLRWLIQQEGVIAIPKSSRRERLEENFDVFGFALSEAEMDRIFALARPDGRMGSPAFAGPWDKE